MSLTPCRTCGANSHTERDCHHNREPDETERIAAEYIALANSCLPAAITERLRTEAVAAVRNYVACLEGVPDRHRLTFAKRALLELEAAE